MLCPFQQFMTRSVFRDARNIFLVFGILLHQLDGSYESLGDVGLKLVIQLLHLGEKETFTSSCVIGFQIVQRNGLNIQLTAATGSNMLMVFQKSFQMAFH